MYSPHAVGPGISGGYMSRGGECRVWVRNFDGRAAGSFEIEVSGDVQTVYEGSLPATDFTKSDEFVFVLQ